MVYCKWTGHSLLSFFNAQFSDQYWKVMLQIIFKCLRCNRFYTSRIDIPMISVSNSLKRLFGIIKFLLFFHLTLVEKLNTCWTLACNEAVKNWIILQLEEKWCISFFVVLRYVLACSIFAPYECKRYNCSLYVCGCCQTWSCAPCKSEIEAWRNDKVTIITNDHNARLSWLISESSYAEEWLGKLTSKEVARIQELIWLKQEC